MVKFSFFSVYFHTEHAVVDVLRSGLWCVKKPDREGRRAKQDIAGIQTVNSFLFGDDTKS